MKAFIRSLGWNAETIGILGLIGLAIWAIASVVSFIHTAGRDAESVRTSRASEVARAEAREDERSAATTAARIAARVSVHVEQSRRAVEAAKEAIRASLPDQAEPVAALGDDGSAGPPAVDPSRMRDALNDLVDRANRAAGDASVSAGVREARNPSSPGGAPIGALGPDR